MMRQEGDGDLKTKEESSLSQDQRGATEIILPNICSPLFSDNRTFIWKQVWHKESMFPQTSLVLCAKMGLSLQASQM